MIILGVNYYFQDSSACIIIDGKLVVALEEERFTRQKHTSEFPENAVKQCLKLADIRREQIDHIAVSIKPSHRWLKKTSYALRQPRKSGSFVKHELTNVIARQNKFRKWLKDTWAKDATPEVSFIEHHISHAAGSFLLSPYKEAALMSIDSSGEWACSWLGHGVNQEVRCLTESFFPHSLGLIFEAVTEFCGFSPGFDESKTMGLAPLGKADRFLEKARDTVSVDAKGRVKVDLRYFDFQYHGSKRCSQMFYDTFGTPRGANDTFEAHHQDVAAAFQQVLEECVLKMAGYLRQQTNCDTLIVTGGIALNSEINGRLIRESGFKDVYITPAAGDNGTSVGAAFTLYNSVLGQPRSEVYNNPFVGNGYSIDEIENVLKASKLKYVRSKNIATDTANLLGKGSIVGWYQGRMEFGPRALGGRSILANPTIAEIKTKINSEVKFREGFRPFSPSVTNENAKEYFDIENEAPFMMQTCQVKQNKQALLPAITHVDGSARVQTVKRETNPLYHLMISELGKKTGVPVVLNTSFNVQGEPMVESPRDAIRCFFSCGLDYLCIGPFIVIKN